MVHKTILSDSLLLERNFSDNVIAQIAMCVLAQNSARALSVSNTLTSRLPYDGDSPVSVSVQIMNTFRPSDLDVMFGTCYGDCVLHQILEHISIRLSRHKAALK